MRMREEAICYLRPSVLHYYTPRSHTVGIYISHRREERPRMILHKFHESKHYPRAVVIYSESYKYATVFRIIKIPRREKPRCDYLRGQKQLLLST